jgi:hypothetical protein
LGVNATFSVFVFFADYAAIEQAGEQIKNGSQQEVASAGDRVMTLSATVWAN